MFGHLTPFRSVRDTDAADLMREISEADKHLMHLETGLPPLESLQSLIKRSMDGGEVFAVDGERQLYNCGRPIALCGAIPAEHNYVPSLSVGSLWIVRTEYLAGFKKHSLSVMYALVSRVKRNYDVLRYASPPKDRNARWRMKDLGFDSKGRLPYGVSQEGVTIYEREYPRGGATDYTSGDDFLSALMAGPEDQCGAAASR